MLDRVFDNYVMGAMQVAVSDALRPPGNSDPYGMAQVRTGLDRIYAWLDNELDGREWAIGADLTMADCAAAPSLFYADWVCPIDARSPRSAMPGRSAFRPAGRGRRIWPLNGPMGTPPSIA
jgi:glutathione S-transferase